MSFLKTCDICFEKFPTLTCYNVCKKCLYDALMNSYSTQPLKDHKIDFITLEKIFSDDELTQICTKHFLKLFEPRLEWFKAMMKNVEDNFEFSEDEVKQCIIHAMKYCNENGHEIYLRTDRTRCEKDFNKLMIKVNKLIHPVKIQDLNDWLKEVFEVSCISVTLHSMYSDLDKIVFDYDSKKTDGTLIRIFDEFVLKGSRRGHGKLWENIYNDFVIIGLKVCKNQDTHSYTMDQKLLRIVYKDAINKSIYKNENCGRCRCNLGVISSSDYTCNVCKRKACKQCLNFEHEDSCGVEDMKLKHYYDTQCQSCPECGIWIEKLNGCDDMFCTFCHTTFSFNDRKRLYGNIHNPHRADYLSSINKTDTNFDVTSEAVYWAMDNLTYLIDYENSTDTDDLLSWLIMNFNKFSSIDLMQIYENLKIDFRQPKMDLDFTFGGLLEDPSVNHYVMSYDVVTDFIDMINPLSEIEMKVRNSLIVDYLSGSDLNEIARFYMRTIVWNRNDDKRKVMIELGEALFKIYQTVLEYRIKDGLFMVDEDPEEDYEYNLSDYEKEVLGLIVESCCPKEMLMRIDEFKDYFD